ncbi:MAG: OmpA family protein, partial [bacterium]
QLEENQANICALRTSFSRSRLYELKKICPARPEDFVAGVNDDACPKFYELQELAGLILKCPVRPEDFDPRAHDQACQKVFTLSENYSPEEMRNIVALAVAEMSLVCPADAANFNAQIHDAACPKYYDLKDTEVLAQRCPPNAEDFKEGVDDAACPKFYTLRDAYGVVDWDEVARLKAIDLDRYGAAILGGEIQTLRPVYFDFGKADILPTARPDIDLVIKVINETPWVSVVRVGGHADARGTVAANEKISMRRAQVVIDYMRANGVRSDVQLIPVAYGSYRPAATNETEEGRSLNRRVIFTVSSYKVPKYSLPPPKKAAATAPKPGPEAATPAAETGTIPAGEEQPPAPPTRWGQ